MRGFDGFDGLDRFTLCWTMVAVILTLNVLVFGMPSGSRTEPVACYVVADPDALPTNSE